MIGDFEIGWRELFAEFANRPNCNMLELVIEVPVTEFNRIGLHDVRPIAKCVVGVSTVIMLVVMMFVMMGAVMMMSVIVLRACATIVIEMDVRVVSSAMAMIDRAHG